MNGKHVVIRFTPKCFKSGKFSGICQYFGWEELGLTVNRHKKVFVKDHDMKVFMDGVKKGFFNILKWYEKGEDSVC